jgi:hypothetical protein
MAYNKRPRENEWGDKNSEPSSKIRDRNRENDRRDSERREIVRRDNERREIVRRDSERREIDRRDSERREIDRRDSERRDSDDRARRGYSDSGNNQRENNRDEADFRENERGRGQRGQQSRLKHNEKRDIERGYSNIVSSSAAASFASRSPDNDFDVRFDSNRNNNIADNRDFNTSESWSDIQQQLALPSAVIATRTERKGASTTA